MMMVVDSTEGARRLEAFFMRRNYPFNSGDKQSSDERGILHESEASKSSNGGEGGIRTLGTLLEYGALAKRCFRPLSHLTLAIV